MTCCGCMAADSQRADLEDRSSAPSPLRLGERYLVFDELGRGGMATVHLGRSLGEGGFSRLVAVKRLRPECSSSYYEKALVREARLGSRIRHANVVQALDVVREGKELVLVMEYVHGVALSRLLDRAHQSGASGGVLPVAVAVSIVADTLAGLHAAHDATDETGRALGIVHRDVSPQNVLVGVDGVARLADFGIAKALRAEELTQTGAVKGKLAYMSPEQLRGFPLTRQADVYAAGILLAQCLAAGALEDAVDARPGHLDAAMTRANVPESLADVVRTATARETRGRYASAAEMRVALLDAHARAGGEEVAQLLSTLAGDDIELRDELTRAAERFDDTAPSAERMRSAPYFPTPAVVVVEPLAPQEETKGPGRRRGYVAAAGAVLVALLTMGYALRALTHDGRDTRAPRELPALPIPTSSGLAMPTVTAPIAETSEVPTTPAASTSATSVTSAASGPRATAQPIKRTNPPTPNCDVPYFLDAQGHKNYRRECLR